MPRCANEARHRPASLHKAKATVLDLTVQAATVWPQVARVPLFRLLHTDRLLADSAALPASLPFS